MEEQLVNTRKIPSPSISSSFIKFSTLHQNLIETNKVHSIIRSMEAGGLQRSEISFRRTGSSGLVWDDKFLGELAKIKPASSQDPDATQTTLPRSRSDGGGADRQIGYKTVKVPSPSVDPPSPKVSGCGGICSIFGASEKEKQPSNKRAKRRI